MPASYRIDLEKRRVYSTGSGEFTFQEAKEQMDRLRRDPDFDPSFSQLLDCNGIEKLSLSPEEVIELAKVNVYSPDSRRAFVAASPVAFGMARIFGAHRASKGETGIRVFSSLKEAQDWLDGGPDNNPPTSPVRKRARA